MTARPTVTKLDVRDIQFALGPPCRCERQFAMRRTGLMVAPSEGAPPD
jgi:hypothetical protein